MSISAALVQVLVQIPECPESLAELYLGKALDTIMGEVDALSEWLVPLRTQDGVRRYPLDVCGEGVALKAVRSVTLDGQTVRGFKLSKSGDELILPDEPGDYQELKIQVALKSDGSGVVPESLAGFENGLVSWALWHLLRIQKQIWYNPALADDFRREYMRDKAVLEAELDAEAAAASPVMARMGNPLGFF